jgi:ferrochelatase
MAKLGVVLLNLGAPATLNDIRPFLRALFSDRDLFPWFFRAFLAPPIAKVRAIQDRPQYRAIGGGSPLGATTQTQADLLKAALPSELHANVYIGMRYSPPTIADALLQAMKDGVDTILLLSSLAEVHRQT